MQTTTAPLALRTADATERDRLIRLQVGNLVQQFIAGREVTFRKQQRLFRAGVAAWSADGGDMRSAMSAIREEDGR